MSDEELIESLRLYGSKFHHEFGHNDAADRIEALIAMHDTMSKLWAKEAAEKNVLAGQCEDLKAKLAKAVGALDKIASGIFNGQLLMSMPPKDPAAEYARATLEKLKGESHD